MQVSSHEHLTRTMADGTRVIEVPWKRRVTEEEGIGEIIASIFGGRAIEDTSSPLPSALTDPGGGVPWYNMRPTSNRHGAKNSKEHQYQPISLFLRVKQVFLFSLFSGKIAGPISFLVST